MIRLTDFTYAYPGSQGPALGPITLEVSPGEFVGVLGPNGSGKSTLCYALAGFLPSHYRGTVGGQVRVGNLDPASLGPSAMVGTVGFVFQDPFSQITGARFTVREEVAFGLENLALPRGEMAGRIETALERTGLTSLAERSPFELSGGEQQRLALASVLALQPSVLILDEPTSQLDPQGARLVIEAVDRLTAERETTVILVEQRTEWLAAHADRTWVLEAGHVIADGLPQAVLSAADLGARGVASPRYTQAARAAQERGWTARTGALPVTLDEAARFFG